MRKYLLLILAFICISSVQAADISPKREMRAGWLTTVYSIDWPSTKSSGAANSIKAQKEELSNILDYLKATNINTALLQVRSRADALYKSDIEPWSVDLSGARGTDPGYDPLAYAIEEAHKRGMELHTWINPYRFESVAGAYAGKPGDYATSNPDWVLRVPTDGQDATILDPGNPDVQAHILSIINDIVTRYDIDGVIFDDYFYLSGITNQDAASQAKYKPASMSVADWRRSNVNTFVSKVNTSIKSIKPYVVFGIGPAGGWTNSRTVALEYGVTPLLDLGVNVWSQYDDIYCDPLAWLRDQTIDYISPQIYWKTDHTNAPYTPLCKWWSDVANKFGRQIYISQYLSEIDYTETGTGAVQTPSIKKNGEIVPMSGLSQIERFALMNSEEYESKSLRVKTIPGTDFITQVENNRDFSKNGAAGSFFYSCNKLRFKSIRELFTDNVFQNQSLRPATWSSFVEEGTPTNLRIEGTTLKWDYTSTNVRFVVYAIPNADSNNTGLFSTAAYLQDVSYTNEYAIPTAKPASSYVYAVSVLDRFGNEFTPIVYGKTITTGAAVSLLTPANNSKAVLPFNFTWQAIDGADYYIFEIAEDAAFTQAIYKRELVSANLSSADMDFIGSGKTYYWRVKAIKASTTINTSEAWKIQANVFKIISPSNNEETTNTPTIKWSEPLNVDKYILEIADISSFASANIKYSASLAANVTEHIVPSGKLLSGYTYYVRIAADNAGVKTYSDIVTIKTQRIEPAVPVILTPTEGESITGSSIAVTWDESPYADRFRVELSTTDDFATTKVKLVDPFVYTTTFDGLDFGDYYIRMYSRYAIAYKTAWSSTRKVKLIDPSSIGNEVSGDNSFRVIRDNGVYYLEINLSTNTNVSASIYSLSGMKVSEIINQQVVGFGNRFVLPDNLNKGIYIINVKTDKGSSPIKWVK